MQRRSPLWMVGDPPPRLLPCGLDVAVGSCVWACCPAGPGAGMPRPAGSWAEPLLEGGPVGVSCVPGTRVAVVAVGSHTATPAEAGAHGVAPGATLSARSQHLPACRPVPSGASAGRCSASHSAPCPSSQVGCCCCVRQ